MAATNLRLPAIPRRLADCLRWLAATLALGLALWGCGGSQTTILHMQGERTEALVTINDRYVGTLGELSRRGIALPPGEYRITVEQVGYFPYDKLIHVGEEPLTVQVQLVAIPD